MTRSKELWQRVAKSAVMYTLFIITSYICMFVLRSKMKEIEDFWDQRLYGIFSFFYMLLIFFSLLSVFLMHDFPYKNRFFAYRKERENGGGKFRFVLSSADFWIDVITLMALTVILPAGAYFEFRNGFLFAVDVRFHFAFFLLCMLPCVLLVTFGAHISTVYWCARPSVKRYEEKRAKRVTEWIGQTVFSMVMYPIGAFALAFVVPILNSAIKALWIFATTLTAIAVLVVLYIVFGKHVRALIYRVSFMRKLKKLCRKQGIRLTQRRNIYSSIFSGKEGSNFTFSMGGTTCSCKLITPLKMKDPVFFSEDGEVTFIGQVYIAEHHRSEKYFFDEDADGNVKRILIVNPGAAKIYATDHIHNRELHSGDRVMGYEVYRTENFLSAIKREYLGR